MPLGHTVTVSGEVISMERYDGKTKRDDYIKYGLITAGVILILAIIFTANHLVRKRYHKEPDYKVVLVSEEAFDAERVEALEAMLGRIVGDLNGDGVSMVTVDALRITDEAYARQIDSDAAESYWAAFEAGAFSEDVEPPAQKYSGLTVETDMGRMMVDLSNGECYLFLLSEQPLGDFTGAASAYREYFMELPENLQSDAFPQYMDISDAPFWAELGIENTTFYGGVLDGDGAETAFALEILCEAAVSHLS